MFFSSVCLCVSSVFFIHIKAFWCIKKNPVAVFVSQILNGKLYIYTHANVCIPASVCLFGPLLSSAEELDISLQETSYRVEVSWPRPRQRSLRDAGWWQTASRKRRGRVRHAQARTGRPEMARCPLTWHGRVVRNKEISPDDRAHCPPGKREWLKRLRGMPGYVQWTLGT